MCVWADKAAKHAKKTDKIFKKVQKCISGRIKQVQKCTCERIKTRKIVFTVTKKSKYVVFCKKEDTTCRHFKTGIIFCRIKKDAFYPKHLFTQPKAYTPFFPQ